jgi:hypothetical protein
MLPARASDVPIHARRDVAAFPIGAGSPQAAGIPQRKLSSGVGTPNVQTGTSMQIWPTRDDAPTHSNY